MPRNAERTRDFSILNMKDTYDDTSQELFAAIQSQNPDADFDSFDMRLRQLVMEMGRTRAYNQFGVMAETVASEAKGVRPIYIEAGDLLALAFDSFKNGDRAEAFELISVAMESSDISLLMQAIKSNNSRSEVGVLSTDDDDTTDDAGSDESVNDDDDSSEDDESDEGADTVYDLGNVDGDDSDNLDTDNEIDSSLKRIAHIASEDEDESEKAKKEEEKVEEENKGKKVPMGNTSSSKIGQIDKATANILALTDPGKAQHFIKSLKK